MSLISAAVIVMNQMVGLPVRVFRELCNTSRDAMVLQILNPVCANAFKYDFSSTDRKISVRMIYFYYLFFHRRPTHKLCFFSL